MAIMYESDNATYDLDNTTTSRIVLALSVALLLHTLVGLALSHYQWSLPNPPQTVEFELVRSGEPAPPPAAAAKASVASPASVATPDKEPTPTPAAATARITTTAESRPIDAARKAKPIPKPQPRKTLATPSPAKADTAPSESSAASRAVVTSANAGEHTMTSDKGATSGITQLTTHMGKPLSAYEKVLWAHIAERIRFAPFMQNLDRIRTVRLELTLMSNGTLEQVRIIDSSNDPTVDQAAKHATIMASPYPPPPETERDNGYRFQVELQFTPASS